MKVAIVIPALDEEATIEAVVVALCSAVRTLGDDAIAVVCDNGSRDHTGVRAEAAGALVVREPRRGYGRACLTALAHVPSDVDVVLFADADGADDPADVRALLQPLRDVRAELVIGSRTLGERERGALTLPQRFGNRLATTLLRLGYGVSTTDLGPFRAIDKRALDRLAMDDEAFGWTVQMQARAARMGMRSVDVPVRYRRRKHGRSKVSGDVRASVKAGIVIVGTLLYERVRAAGGKPPPYGEVR